jgi:hypothetical protein
MDPRESIRRLSDRLGGDRHSGSREASGECLTADQLLEAARGDLEHSNAHLVECPSCNQMYEIYRQELAKGDGLQAFLRVARAKAASYERERGSRWLTRVASYFVVSRNGRIATAAMGACALLLAGMVIWDRSVPPPSPSPSVFEAETYTRAVNKLSDLVSDMNGQRVKGAEEVRNRVSEVNSLLRQAQAQPLRGEQRAEIINLRFAYETAKEHYAVSEVPQVQAGDSVAALIKSLQSAPSPADGDSSRQWALISVSVKGNKESAEKIILQSRSSGPVPKDDPAISTLESFATREATYINWKDVALFEPGRPVQFVQSGLR